MSDIVNEIILRPRFDIRLHAQPEEVKTAFDVEGISPFEVNRIDEHVYIRFSSKETNFWTPQLHLEIMSYAEGTTNIHGVFGPNPTLWTFFMFVHFGVATAFLILAAFAYSNYSLGKEVGLYVMFMILLIGIWFGLYVFGRIGKKKGKPQMQALRRYADRLFIQIQRTYAS